MSVAGISSVRLRSENSVVESVLVRCVDVAGPVSDGVLGGTIRMTSCPVLPGPAVSDSHAKSPAENAKAPISHARLRGDESSRCVTIYFAKRRSHPAGGEGGIAIRHRAGVAFPPMYGSGPGGALRRGCSLPRSLA